MKQLSILKKNELLTVVEPWLITIHPGVRNIPIGIAMDVYRGDEHAGYWMDKENRSIGYHPYNITENGREYHKIYDLIIEPDTVLVYRGIKYSDSYMHKDAVMFSIKEGNFQWASFWVTIEEANKLIYK